MVFLEDEDKQSLWDRYFDIVWCDDVSDLRCVHCHRVAINHCVSSCEHIFCKMCSKFYNDEDQSLKCPRCQEFISKPDEKDFDVEVKIHQLMIFCPNKKYGCHYAHQLQKIPSHLKTCTHTRKAALPAKSPEIYNNDDVNKRIENEVKENFDQLEKKIEDIDSKVIALIEKITSLEKKVEETNVGIDLASKKHTEELQSIKSLLKSIKSSLKSIDQTSKTNESVHENNIGTISTNSDEMRFVVASMTQKDSKTIQDKKSEEISIRKVENYDWIIPNLKKNHLNDDWTIESDTFLIDGCKYDIKAMLESKYGSITISLQFKDGDRINKDVNKFGFTKIKYTIRDQKNSGERDLTYEFELGFTDCLFDKRWLFIKQLSPRILDYPYTMNGCLKIGIAFEPPSTDKDFAPNNGVLTWVVDNYWKKKAHSTSGFWSPSFYSGPGYRVKTWLKINRTAPMEISVYFLTGKHDDRLSYHFPHTITVTLVHPTDPSKSIGKSVQFNEVTHRRFQLEKRRHLARNGFINNDTLVLKVEIESAVSKRLNRH